MSQEEDDQNQAIHAAGADAEKSWLDALRKAQDDFEASTTDYGTSYYPQSEEQLGWTDINSKLVRLDIAILAIHLVADRVCFRAMPTAHGIILNKIIGKAKEKGEEWLLTRTLRSLPGAKILEGFAKFLVDIFIDARTQKSLELTIKLETFGGMKAIRAICLAHKRKRKHTATVFTRHYSPRQRKANGFAG